MLKRDITWFLRFSVIFYDVMMPIYLCLTWSKDKNLRWISVKSQVRLFIHAHKKLHDLLQRLFHWLFAHLFWTRMGVFEKFIFRDYIQREAINIQEPIGPIFTVVTLKIYEVFLFFFFNINHTKIYTRALQYKYTIDLEVCLVHPLWHVRLQRGIQCDN